MKHQLLNTIISICFLLLLFFMSSCGGKLNESDVNGWIQKGNSDALLKDMYKNERVDQEKFARLVTMYADTISKKELVAKPFVDQSLRGNLSERKRVGQNFYDADGNLHYSLTYRFVAIDRKGTEKINFIDFRSTDGDLPCVKVPSFAPIRCIYTPQIKVRNVPMHMYIDSLRAIGPITVGTFDYHHYDVIKDQNRKHNKYSVKNTIVINVENNWVKAHFDILTKDLEKMINLDEYNLAYIRDVSTPTLRIGFDAGFRPDVLTDVVKYFESRLQSKMILTPLYDKEFVPMKGDVVIGHAYEEKRKIKLGW